MKQTATEQSVAPVLLIEDEPAVMAYVRAALERSGYTVVCSESGAEGVRLLETGDFMGVVSDMRTPGGVDGADVHAHQSGGIRVLESGPHTLSELRVVDYGATTDNEEGCNDEHENTEP